VSLEGEAFCGVKFDACGWKFFENGEKIPQNEGHMRPKSTKKGLWPF
jgi:hypothetical protein